MENLFCFAPALVYHVPQFLEKCGGLSIFNCQPVEKKNHQQSRMFHQGTQKGGRKSSYTKQVMEKENRKIYARVNNLYRTKRTYQRSGHTEEDLGALHLYTHQHLEEGQNVLYQLTVSSLSFKFFSVNKTKLLISDLYFVNDRYMK